MSLAALFVSTISLADGDFVSIHRWMFTTVFPPPWLIPRCKIMLTLTLSFLKSQVFQSANRRQNHNQVD